MLGVVVQGIPQKPENRQSQGKYFLKVYSIVLKHFKQLTYSHIIFLASMLPLNSYFATSKGLCQY